VSWDIPVQGWPFSIGLALVFLGALFGGLLGTALQPEGPNSPIGTWNLTELLTLAGAILLAFSYVSGRTVDERGHERQRGST
jgi:hypothetical protein